MPDTDFSSLIKKIRAIRGVTQEELAHELDVTLGTLNGWENGRHRPVKAQRKRLEAMGRDLGISVEAVTRLPGDEPGAASEGGRDE